MNLLKRDDVLKCLNDGSYGLEPSFIKLLYVYNGEYLYEITGNRHGYAFMYKVPISIYEFEIYLISISFYSAFNSKVLSNFRISLNEHCDSLSEERYLASKDVDEIPVSFICNT